MAPSNIAHGSTSGHHCLTCTCVPNDISPVNLDSSSFSLAMEEEIQCFDKEIERISDVLIALKRRRNARLPVARIPPELLSEIFIYFRDASTPPIATDWKTNPWIFITHVSALWRSVALNNPRLWNIVNLRFPDLVYHSSRHFASVPLHLMLSHGRYNRRTRERGLDAILGSRNPILSLEMRAESGEEAIFILQSLLPRAANNVLYLDIGLLGPRIDGLQILQTIPTPKLQILSLENVELDLSCSFLASCTWSLRELKLSRCRILEGNYKALESFVRLEKLWLSDQRYDGFGAIHLPRVTEFYLKDDGLDSIFLSLKAFLCSRGCTITVCPVPRYSYLAQELAPLVAYISSAHPDHARARIADKFVELYYEGENAHYTLHYTCHRVMPSPSVLPLILPHDTAELSLTCDADVGISHSQLEVICGAVETVHSLDVCGHHLVVSLNTCLREKEDFLPSLSLIRVCNCSAEWGGQLLQTVQLCEGLDAHVGGIDLCRGLAEVKERGK